MRAQPLFFAAMAAGCAAAPDARAPGAVVVLPAAPAPKASSEPPPARSVVAREPDRPGVLVRATSAMRMEGDVSETGLVSAVDRQLGPLDRCVSLVRETDRVVGSLNLRVVVGPEGSLATTLQSPLDAEAARCLLDGLATIRAPGIGRGTAMVLLVLRDRDGAGAPR